MEDRLKKIKDYIKIQINPKENILEHLILIQNICGGVIDKEIQEALVELIGIEREELEDTIEFFPFLRQSRDKIKVEVCMGTSCYMAGNSIIEGILRNYEDNRVEVVEKECSENCDYGPRVCVKHKTFQYVTEEDIPDIIHFAQKEWEK